MCIYIYIYDAVHRDGFSRCFEGWHAFTLDDSLDDPRKVERTRREKETRKNSFIGHRDAASPFLATNTDFPRKNPLEKARVGKTATIRFFLEPCQSTRMDDERESMVSERERERERSSGRRATASKGSEKSFVAISAIRGCRGSYILGENLHPVNEHETIRVRNAFARGHRLVTTPTHVNETNTY